MLVVRYKILHIATAHQLDADRSLPVTHPMRFPTYVTQRE